MGDGPKQVTCSICGEQVLKAQTSHIGNGERACKSHSNTDQQALNAQQNIKNKHSKGRTIKTRAHWSKQPLRSTIGPTCTLCGKEGIPIADIYKLMLYGMEKIRASGQQLDFINMPEQIKTALNIEEKYKILFPITEISDDLKKKLLTTKIRSVKEVLALIFSMHLPLVLCNECMKRHNVKYENKPKTMPPLKTLHILGSAYENSEYKANLKRIAEAQVRAERIKESSKN